MNKEKGKDSKLVVKEEIEDELTCSICLRIFHLPTTTPCGKYLIVCGVTYKVIPSAASVFEKHLRAQPLETAVFVEQIWSIMTLKSKQATS